MTHVEADRSGTAVRVLVADDQPAMRTALRTILEAGGANVVGEVADGETAVERCAAGVVTVALMDVRMPGRGGIAATAEMTRRAPGTRVLVLTTFDDDATLFGALRAGAAGFLLKNSPPEVLQQAVRQVAGGDSVLDHAVVGRVMRHVAVGRPNQPEADDIARLTEREKDILFLLVHGASNAELARWLGITEATTKTHVSRVIVKLGVRDRLQAVVRAYESGFAALPRHVQPHRP